MNVFETLKGQNIMESIAGSMVRIAKALEENNRLVASGLQAEVPAKHPAQSETVTKSPEKANPEIV